VPILADAIRLEAAMAPAAGSEEPFSCEASITVSMRVRCAKAFTWTLESYVIGPSEQVFRNRHRISVNIFRIRVLDQKRLPMKTTASPWHWQRHEGV
jgi:hypothetical protein